MKSAPVEPKVVVRSGWRWLTPWHIINCRNGRIEEVCLRVPHILIIIVFNLTSLSLNLIIKRSLCITRRKKNENKIIAATANSKHINRKWMKKTSVCVFEHLLTVKNNDMFMLANCWAVEVVCWYYDCCSSVTADAPLHTHADAAMVTIQWLQQLKKKDTRDALFISLIVFSVQSIISRTQKKNNNKLWLMLETVLSTSN